MPVKAQPQDLPAMEGPGVSRLKIKELDRLGDKMNDKLEARSALSGEITKIEGQMAEIMQERGISKYHWADKVMEIKLGKVHVKVKTVRSEGVDGDNDEALQ
jgi:hypothetical protein